MLFFSDVNECLLNGRKKRSVLNEDEESSSDEAHSRKTRQVPDDRQLRPSTDLKGAGYENECSDICVNTPGSYQCACPDGKILHSDGYTCLGKVNPWNASSIFGGWNQIYIEGGPWAKRSACFGGGSLWGDIGGGVSKKSEEFYSIGWGIWS